MVEIIKEVIVNNYDDVICDVERGNYIYEMNFSIDPCEHTTHIIFPLGSKEERTFNRIVEYDGNDGLWVKYEINGQTKEFISLLNVCLSVIAKMCYNAHLDSGENYIDFECGYHSSLEVDKILKKLATDFEKIA